MRVFVAGATGVIGRRVVVRFVPAGHDVTGIARTPDKAAQLRRAGARPVAVSLFDPDALRDAVAGHDAVVNLATKIPTLAQGAEGGWAENTRIRVEGSRNLVDAAIAAGALCSYRSRSRSCTATTVTPGSTRRRPRSPTRPSATRARGRANALRFTANGGRGVVLRFGVFQASDSYHARFDLRRGPPGCLPRSGAARWLPAGDRGRRRGRARSSPRSTRRPACTTSSTTSPSPGATTRRPSHGRRARRLHPPAGRGLAAAQAGPLADSQRVSNRRFRDATGWRPVTRNQRDAVAQIALPEATNRARRRRLGSALAARGLGPRARHLRGVLPARLLRRLPLRPHVGYARRPVQRAPRTRLRRDEPRARGRHARRAVLRLAGGGAGGRVGWLVFSVPHAIYHFRHLSHYETADQIGNVVSLGFAVLLAIAALVPSPAARRARVELVQWGRW